MARSQRAEFLVMLGESYTQYGMPSICGWVEGLLLLDRREWSQRAISASLREMFPESRYPASVPSVNRALRILEDYGVVEKSGSRKTGFIYRVSKSSNLVTSMLVRFAAMSKEFKRTMREFSGRIDRDDAALKKAALYEVKMADSWIDLMERMLDPAPEDKED